MLFDPGALVCEANRRRGLVQSLFPAQEKLRQDPSMFKAVQTSRRSGKTTWAMIDWLIDSHDYTDSEYAYCALTRTSARNISWPIIRGLNRKFDLGLRLRESILRIEKPSGAACTFYGADRPDWMERLYGQKLRKVYIDEAAFYSANLRYLVNDVLEPAVTDLEGQITLMSRPGHNHAGLFYDACHGEDPGWSLHKWSWMHNPHIRKQTLKLIKRRTAANPDYLDSAYARRNWKNEWVAEVDNPVYNFNAERNGLPREVGDKLLKIENIDKWRFVCGIDFGWTHKTAFVVVGWRIDQPELFEFESYSESELSMDRICRRVKMYQEMYPGIRFIADPDGKREYADLARRFGPRIQPAEKSQKRYWITLCNNELGAGRIKIVAPASSEHVAEMLSLRWLERKGDLVRDRNRELVEGTEPNDCCDAFLYAFRLAWNYRWTKEKKRPAHGSPAYFDELAEIMEQQAEEYYRTKEMI